MRINIYLSFFLTIAFSLMLTFKTYSQTKCLEIGAGPTISQLFLNKDARFGDETVGMFYAVNGFKIQPGLQVSVIHKRGIADFFALGIGLQYRRSVHQFNYSARTWNRKIYPEDSCDILGFETTYKGTAHMDIHLVQVPAQIIFRLDSAFHIILGGTFGRTFIQFPWQYELSGTTHDEDFCPIAATGSYERELSKNIFYSEVSLSAGYGISIAGYPRLWIDAGFAHSLTPFQSFPKPELGMNTAYLQLGYKLKW